MKTRRLDMKVNSLRPQHVGVAIVSGAMGAVRGGGTKEEPKRAKGVGAGEGPHLEPLCPPGSQAQVLTIRWIRCLAAPPTTASRGRHNADDHGGSFIL